VHVRDNASGKYPRAQAIDIGWRCRFLNPNAPTQQRSRHGRWKAEIDSLASMRTFLAIPPSTSAIPPSKTALIISRGLINWYCIVRGVKCPISNLGGFTVPNSIVRGLFRLLSFCLNMLQMVYTVYIPWDTSLFLFGMNKAKGIFDVNNVVYIICPILQL
jgi:hypothetical protein